MSPCSGCQRRAAKAVRFLGFSDRVQPGAYVYQVGGVNVYMSVDFVRRHKIRAVLLAAVARTCFGRMV
jgi:hypothetical protein